MKKLILFLGAGLLASGCYYDNQEDLYQNLEDNSCNLDSVTYQQTIAPLVEANCATSGCHLGPNGIGGLDLSTYGDLKSIADNGQLLGHITGTSGNLMPPTGSLPDCDIEKIRLWVNEGAPEN